MSLPTIYSQDVKADTELIFGLVSPIGSNRKLIADNLKDIAAKFNYKIVSIRVSDLIKSTEYIKDSGGDEYKRIVDLMDAGDRIREKDEAELAKRAAQAIAEARKQQVNKRVIYLIDSLKHRAEVHELRTIYANGFYLFAVHSSEESKLQFLQNHCNIQEKTKQEALIKRDEAGKDHAQNTSDAFHLADFFLTENGNNLKVYNSLQRFLDIIFGDPFRTPTFHEFAMFTAHTSAMRSSDMSRQVGAVITKGTDVISTGANECPKAGGGGYWPLFDDEKNVIYDVAGGRDYMREHDFNAKEKLRLIEAITEGIAEEVLKHESNNGEINQALLIKLKDDIIGRLNSNIDHSGLKDITEYGRVVHAEMDAILTCARRGVSCNKAVLFCTTFPCHNCAKHIVASGIKSVVYIEPYPKSKALEMHADSISNADQPIEGKVSFVPFVGVGPRQFINLFSVSLSYGAKISRKKPGSSEKAEYDRSNASPRVKMFDLTHTQIESSLSTQPPDIKNVTTDAPSAGN